MFILIILSILSAVAVIATTIEIRRDGLRPARTDWTRVNEYGA